MAKINIKSTNVCFTRGISPFQVFKYILPSEIAELFQTNVTNIVERIKHLGIKPISGPTIDNGLVYVFERKDIISINKQQLDKVQGYQTAIGIPKRTNDYKKQSQNRLYGCASSC
jgi:hypothetical protein